MTLQTCDRCGVALQAKIQKLKIQTEAGKHTFCEECVRDGFVNLSMKRKRTVDEVMLLAKFRKWLRMKIH